MTTGYATWAVYQVGYGGVADEKTFDKLNYRVSRLLDAFTGNRSRYAEGEKAARLNDCACRLIDMVANLEGSGAGHGLQSVSNDGYTEHYAVTDPEEVTRILRRAAFQSLSGTGLMGAM